MSENIEGKTKGVTRELKTEFSFTEEAQELFGKVANNQNEIINKQNEIETLIKKNTAVFHKYNALSEYMKIMPSG